MPRYCQVQFVIFDMDGLILDTESIYFKTFAELLREYGKDYTDDVRVKVMGTVPKDTYATFIKEYNLAVTVDEFAQVVEKRLLKNFESVSLMPGAERLIRHFKKCGVPIAVATSSNDKTFAVKTAKHQELFSNFHHIVLGSVDPEVKSGKPAPDIFLVCASRFDEKPDPCDCLVFEDAPNGVQGAITAGMQAVLVHDPIVPQEKRDLATLAIPSLLDFVPEEFGLPPL